MHHSPKFPIKAACVNFISSTYVNNFPLPFYSQGITGQKALG